MQSLPLASLLLDALPRPDPQEQRNRLRIISELTAPDVRIIASEFAVGLERMLMDSINSLKKSFTAMEDKMKSAERNNSAASKFSVSTEMKCGTIEDFHEGLEGHIGDSWTFSRL